MSSLRSRVRYGAVAVLLAGPTALAFFTGGYFSAARDGAGVAASGLALLAVALDGPRLPRSRGGRLALLGAGLLSVWTLVSTLWAPIAGTAYGAGGLAVLYFVGLIAATLLLRPRSAQMWLEPAVAAGTLIVVSYGLSGRLLPGVLHLARSVSADGRLEQPLTYWNAMGELAAIGLVLCVRLAGDARRPRVLRAAAAAAAAPLGMGLYAAFSRGALFACVAGLLTLVVATPSREQRRGLIVSMSAAILAAVAIAPLSGVASLAGSQAHQEHQGAIALVIVLGLMFATAAVMWAITRRPAPAGPVRLPPHAALLAIILTCAGLALAIGVGAKEKSGVPITGGAGRLTTFQSNRYDYWDVALKAFAHDPVVGVGAGGWAVWWLRERPYPDGATDAHSLELQTLAELGLVGVGLLAMLLLGTGLAARSAHRLDAAAAAGPLAGVVVWLAHSPLDWDWQMPAVTLVAVLLAGGLVAMADGQHPDTSAAAPGPEAAVVGLTPSRSAVAVTVLRPVSVVLALVVCAWFVLGIRQADGLSREEAILNGAGTRISAAAAHRVRSALDEAGTLNPDRQVDLDRALLLDREGQTHQAAAVADAVTRAEPQNLNAWIRAAESTGGDVARYRVDLGHVDALEPRLP